MRAFSQEEWNMPRKIDPLSKKSYGAVSAMVTVAVIKAAVGFFDMACGFKRR